MTFVLEAKWWLHAKDRAGESCGYTGCTLQILFLRDGSSSSKDRSHSVPLTTVHTTGGSTAIAISGTHLSSPSVSFSFFYSAFRFKFPAMSVGFHGNCFGIWKESFGLQEGLSKAYSCDLERDSCWNWNRSYLVLLNFEKQRTGMNDLQKRKYFREDFAVEPVLQTTNKTWR